MDLSQREIEESVKFSGAKEIAEGVWVSPPMNCGAGPRCEPLKTRGVTNSLATLTIILIEKMRVRTLHMLTICS
jgi:hypothetical protein